MTDSIVLRGGTVLTMDAAHTVLADCDVLVVDDRIAAVGPALEVPEPYGAQKPGQVAAQAAHGGFGRRSRIHRHHEKHGGARKRCDDRLRNRGWHASLLTNLSGGSLSCGCRVRRTN